LFFICVYTFLVTQTLFTKCKRGKYTMVLLVPLSAKLMGFRVKGASGHLHFIRNVTFCLLIIYAQGNLILRSWWKILRFYYKVSLYSIKHAEFTTLLLHQECFALVSFKSLYDYRISLLMCLIYNLLKSNIQISYLFGECS